MKRLALCIVAALTLYAQDVVRTESAGDGPDPWFGTFSIIAFDPATGEFGSWQTATEAGLPIDLPAPRASAAVAPVRGVSFTIASQIVATTEL